MSAKLSGMAFFELKTFVWQKTASRNPSLMALFPSVANRTYKGFVVEKWAATTRRKTHYGSDRADAISEDTAISKRYSFSNPSVTHSKAYAETSSLRCRQFQTGLGTVQDHRSQRRGHQEHKRQKSNGTRKLV